MRIAVVIPTYNEAENLPRIVGQLDALALEGLGYVIVDDGSPDGTGRIADGLSVTHPGRFIVLHRQAKQGLGRAYVAGFRAALDAGAQQILEMDADLSHSPGEVPAMLAKLTEADVVTGSRYVRGGSVDPAWNFGRRQTSAWGNRGIRWITGLRVKDATSGFKAFRRSALETIGVETLRTAGFGFQAEVAFACQRAALKVVEHPYAFIDRKLGRSKMSLAIALEAVCRLTLLRLRGR
jgi:dolichol-phosphate mannosyltransferase